MIALASDHAGFELKEAIKKHLIENNYDIMDFGTNSKASCDYPEFANKAAEAVALGQCEKGIVSCGTGIGVSIVANKTKGIRCALVTNEFLAEMCKRHNNANMIAFGSRVLDVQTVIRLLDIWLYAHFEEGRHKERIDQIDKL